MKEDRLTRHEKELNETLDAITTLADKAETEERDFDADEQKEYDGYKLRIEELKALIARDKEIEELQKSRAKPIDPKPQDGEERSGAGVLIPKYASSRKRIKAALLVDMAKALYFGGGQPHAAIRAAQDMELKEAVAVFKAATAPADTVTATWANELMQEAYGAFIDLLRPMSIYARAPSQMAVLGRNGKVLLPGLTTGVGGGWVGEGKPAPVKQGVFNRQELLPTKLMVIVALTRELLQRSDPAADTIIRDSMLRDTGIVLDTTFASNDAAVAGVKPAGIQTYDPAPTASTGTTITDIDADLSGMVNAMLGNNMDDSLFWLINPIRTNALRYKSTATGTYPYRDDIDNGMLGGYPYLKSNTQPNDVVTLVHSDSFYKLMEGAVEMAMSMDATLHFEDTNPEIIGTPGSPNVVAAPVRNMFQEDSVALRLMMPAAYMMVRTGSVKVLTGVAW